MESKTPGDLFSIPHHERDNWVDGENVSNKLANSFLDNSNNRNMNNKTKLKLKNNNQNQVTDQVPRWQQLMAQKLFGKATSPMPF